MEIITAAVMAVVYNLSDMIGLYGMFFAVETAKLFKLL